MPTPGSRPAVPPPDNSGRQRAEALGGQAATAAKAALAFYRGWRSGKAPASPVDIERQRQAARYTSAMASYRRRAVALRTRLVAGGTVAVSGATMSAATMSGAAEGSLIVVGITAAAAGTWQAVKGRQGLRTLVQPSPPPPIIPPAQPLPPGTRGAESAARVTGIRMHIMELLPTLDQLHPTAGDEVRAADAVTAAGLNALVERIRSMHRIMAQMPGTPAAHSARMSIDAMAGRLQEGAGAYQELLAAVIALSTAPEIGAGPSATLQPAILEMRAYAAGLEAVARI